MSGFLCLLAFFSSCLAFLVVQFSSNSSDMLFHLLGSSLFSLWTCFFLGCFPAVVSGEPFLQGGHYVMVPGEGCGITSPYRDLGKLPSDFRNMIGDYKCGMIYQHEDVKKYKEYLKGERKFTQASRSGDRRIL